MSLHDGPGELLIGVLPHARDRIGPFPHDQSHDGRADSVLVQDIPDPCPKTSGLSTVPAEAADHVENPDW
jgi:hypothetical protein